MPTDDKGKFQTTIGLDVIEAAMKSVDKAKGVELPIDPAPAAEPPPEAAPEPPPEAAPLDPRDQELEELKAALEMSMAKGRDFMGKIRDEHEKMLRAVADLENFKKRAQKEREEVQKFGNERLLKDFLPVMDNLERALANVTDLESLKTGVTMIRKLFDDTLGKHGIRPFSAVGRPFDPSRHEAMGQAESAELPPNSVHTEVLRGYTLNDRLVRPALVVVSRAPSQPAPAAEAPPAPEPAEEPKS